jgi:hypothetical protein
MKRELKEIEIAAKLKTGMNFIVGTERERKRALSAAKYLGIEVSTKANPIGFTVFVNLVKQK